MFYALDQSKQIAAQTEDTELTPEAVQGAMREKICDLAKSMVQEDNSTDEPYEWGSSTKVEETEGGFVMRSGISINAAGGSYQILGLSGKMAGAVAKKGFQLFGITMYFNYLFLAVEDFSGDVLFFNEDDFKENGLKNGIHLNALKLAEHPLLQEKRDVLAPEIVSLLLELDAIPELRISKEKLHKKLIPLLFNDHDEPLTGMTMMNLLAYHMLFIQENQPDDYTVAIDRNLVAGIPDAYHYAARFLRQLRLYNGKDGAFTVTFATAANFDSPIQGALKPVEGAAQSKSAYRIQVEPDGGIQELETAEAEEQLAAERSIPELEQKAASPEKKPGKKAAERPQGKRVPLMGNLSILLPEGGVCKKEKDGSYFFSIPIKLPGGNEDVWNITNFEKLNSIEGAFEDTEDSGNWDGTALTELLQSISGSTASLLKVLMIGVFPLAYLGVGVCVIAKRRRDQYEAG